MWQKFKMDTQSLNPNSCAFTCGVSPFYRFCWICCHGFQDLIPEILSLFSAPQRSADPCLCGRSSRSWRSSGFSRVLSPDCPRSCSAPLTVALKYTDILNNPVESVVTVKGAAQWKVQIWRAFVSLKSILWCAFYFTACYNCSKIMCSICPLWFRPVFVLDFLLVLV